MIPAITKDSAYIQNKKQILMQGVACKTIELNHTTHPIFKKNLKAQSQKLWKKFVNLLYVFQDLNPHIKRTYDADGNILSFHKSKPFGPYKYYEKGRIVCKEFRDSNTNQLLEKHSFDPETKRILRQEFYNTANGKIKRTITHNYYPVTKLHKITHTDENGIIDAVMISDLNTRESLKAKIKPKALPYIKQSY